MYPAWQKFERVARETFANYGVTVLHTKELHDTDGEFRGWSVRKKQSFITELYSHFDPTKEAGISYSTRQDVYLKRKKEHGFRYNANMSALGYCFHEICVLLLQASALPALLRTDPSYNLSFVIESGNRNNEDVVRIFNDLKTEIPELRFNSLSIADKSSSVVLQIADFLAFHSRRYVTKCEEARQMLPEPTMLSIALNSLHHEVKVAVDFLKPTRRSPKLRDRTSPILGNT